MATDRHVEEVRNRIARVLESGCASFIDLLERTDGADPRLVEQLLKDFGRDPFLERPGSVSGPTIRSTILECFPAPDPALGQWWYTPDTQERLVQRALDLKNDTHPYRVLCVGAPTLAPQLIDAGCETTVAEIDEDTVKELQSICRAKIINCDLLNDELNVGDMHLAIVDPPWYRDEMMAFLEQGLRAIEVGGFLMVSLPPLLTRPEVQQERTDVLNMLTKQGADVVFLDRNILRYAVPRFEESAFSDVAGFCGHPWRVADLLICKKNREARKMQSAAARATPITIQRFSRNPREFRVFLGKCDTLAGERTTIAGIDEFSRNVSRRAHKGDIPNIWTSEKRGAMVEKVEEAQAILECWQKGGSRTDAEKILQDALRLSPATSREVVQKYDAVLELWSRFDTGIGRRLPQEIAKAKKAATSKWATGSTDREHSGDGDGFRLEFPRDRDRIHWSGSFRKLAGKTQLFPVTEGDQLRQRLAHSIEVMQLASTIADSFGLDCDLVEAGALAHDIGHTPFGHAGEHAIDKLLLEISPGSNSPGFNHYEHGVDVVRYLEGPYQYVPRKGHMGLNLTPEVCECIFKHTYCQGGPRISHDEIRKLSKHSTYLKDGYCHLEGQAVRIADKVSYLVSDIEDGIRLGVVDDRMLLSCRLFHRPPIDTSQPRGESLATRFLIQRRNLLSVLMEDIITETGRRLSRIMSPNNVRGNDGYLIDHSPALNADVCEIWEKIQVGRLHKDARVIRANMKAGKIVAELLLLTAIIPEFVSDEMRREHERLWSGPYVKYYKDALGPQVTLDLKLIKFLPLDRNIGLGKSVGSKGYTIRTEHLVLAKDYVASLTDEQARKLYYEYLG